MAGAEKLTAGVVRPMVDAESLLASATRLIAGVERPMANSCLCFASPLSCSLADSRSARRRH